MEQNQHIVGGWGAKVLVLGLRINKKERDRADRTGIVWRRDAQPGAFCAWTTKPFARSTSVPTEAPSRFHTCSLNCCQRSCVDLSSRAGAPQAQEAFCGGIPEKTRGALRPERSLLFSPSLFGRAKQVECRFVLH